MILKQLKVTVILITPFQLLMTSLMNVQLPEEEEGIPEDELMNIFNRMKEYLNKDLSNAAF